MSLDDIRMRIILGVGGFEAVNKASSAIKGVSSAAQKAADATAKSGTAAQKTSGLFGRLADKLRETESMYDRVYRAGFQLQLVGGMLNDAGEKSLGILGGAVDKYKDYDLMLRRAGVALNTNESWQTKLDKAIQATAVSVGLVKPEEAAEAYYMWGAATGVVVDNQKALNDITGTVNDVLVATAAAGGDLERNLKGVYGVMQVYNRGADEGQYITHVLALMTERTAADFGDLINAFSYIGPLASSIGISFEDTAQLLGFLADAGQRGSRAGRGLSMILEGLSNPSEKAKAALDKVIEGAFGVGKEFSDIVFPKGDFIGMRGFIDAMAKSLTGLNDEQRGYVYSAAFTNNATRALIPVVEKQIKLWDEQTKAGKELTSVLDQQKYALDGAGEFFEKMQSQMQGSINAVIGSFQNSFFPIIQKVATEVMRLLIPVLDFLKDRFADLSNFLDHNPGFTQALVMFLAIAGVILVVLGTVLGLVGSFLLLGAGIGTVVALLPAIAAAAAPVFAAIAALVGIGLLLYKGWTENWGGIQQIVGNTIDAIKAGLSVLIGWVQKATDIFNSVVNGGSALTTCLQGLPEPIAAIAGWMGQLWVAVQAGVQQILPTLITIFETASDLFVNHVIPGIQQVVAAFQVFWAFLQPILIQLGAILVETIINKVIPMFVEFATAVGTYLIEILQQLGPVIDSVIQLFTGLINFIFVDLAPVWDWLLTNIFIPFFTVLVDLFVTRLGAIIHIVTGAWEVVKGVIQIALGIIKGVIDIFLAAVNGKWDKAGQALETMVNTVWNGIKAIINGVLTIIRGLIEFALTKIVEIIGGGLNAAKNLFGSILGKILDIIKGGAGKMVDLGKGLLQALWNGISGAIGWLANLIGGFLGTFIGWFAKKLPQSMQDIGKNVIEGIWNGIKSLAGWLASKVINLVKDIIPGPIRDALGIHSPSRVTMELGRMVALGLAAGIVGNTAPVLDSVDSLTGAVIARAGQGGKDMGKALGEAGLSATANYSFSAQNEKTITLRVEVVSPDGSVDRLTTDQLAGLLKGSDLLEAIEHAASLD